MTRRQREAVTILLYALSTLLMMALFFGVCQWAFAQQLYVQPLVSQAPPFRLADVCPGFTLSTNRAKAEVYLRCPPDPQPWIVIRECTQPRVTRHANGKDVDIYCVKPTRT